MEFARIHLQTLLFLFTCALQVTSFRRRPSFPQCGRQSVPPDVRVVGGTTAKPYSWPWMVSLNTVGSPLATGTLRNSGHNCGGVLINKEWVLTAAHCLDNPNQPNVFPRTPPKEWIVIGGMHNRDANSSDIQRWQRRGVRRFFHHPQFRDLGYSAYNDIALLQLDKPMLLSTFVRPICLPNRRITAPGWNRCYTAGWGTTDEDSDYYSLTLQEAEIPVINYFTCKSRFRGAYGGQQHLCGGDWYEGKKDSCKGDSGGPLACKLEDGTWYVAGIVSWGVGCGRQRSPGVYTNVRNYENWILYILLYFSPENTFVSQRFRAKRDAAFQSPFMERLLNQQ